MNLDLLYDDLQRCRVSFEREVDRLHYKQLLAGNEISRADIEAYYLADSMRGRHMQLINEEIQRWQN